MKLGGRIPVAIDISPLLADDVHGYAEKDMIVLHETVSPNYPGIGDIIAPTKYLGSKGYGIHAVIDAEGNLGYAKDNEKARFYHCASTGTLGRGYVNTRSCGIELVSRVMIDKKDNVSRFTEWWERDKQLNRTAQVIAWWSHLYAIPLRYSDGRTPGVTTHWQVSKTFGVPGGHWDCWPKHKGGYFPVLRVIYRARHLQRRYGWGEWARRDT